MVATYAKYPEFAYKTLREILRDMSYEELPIIRRQITLILEKARSKKNKGRAAKIIIRDCKRNYFNANQQGNS